MKLIGKLSSLAILASLVSCADMSSEATLDQNVPADFSTAVYAELHPDVPNFQIRDAIRAYNKANKASLSADQVVADSAEFFSDTAWVHELFTDYVGYNDTLWNSEALVLDKEQFELVNAYNRVGKSDDKAYVQGFAVDSQLVLLQYSMVGLAEGRAYRYCGDSDAKTEVQDPAKHAIAISKKAFDFSPHTFCYNQNDNLVYLIK